MWRQARYIMKMIETPQNMLTFGGASFSRWLYGILLLIKLRRRSGTVVGSGGCGILETHLWDVGMRAEGGHMSLGRGWRHRGDQELDWKAQVI